MPTLHPRSIKDFESLLEYLREELDWDVDPDSAEEYSFSYTAKELGLSEEHAVGIEEALQIRTYDETLPVFWFKFNNKRLPIVVLRRILRAFVAKKRPGANSSTQKTYARPDDLFFICALGEADNRGLTLAHFRPLENEHLAQLRTFSWDQHETHFHYLEKHLKELKWDNRADWSRAFIAEHGRTIRDAKELALSLAEFAREIRDYTKSLYEVEAANGALHELHKNFGALLGSTTSDEFADAVAQTVTSALLAVRFEGHTLENVALTEIQHKIPFTNPFLTEFIEHLARIGFNHEQGVDFDDLGIEDLKAFLNAVNIEAIKEKFGSTAQGGAQDPVIHFYETFLAAYDSAERMKRGVYYTPKPVVDFIVRGVDHLLREELGFAMGLADASQDDKGNYNVTILDPATGTGTFLVSVVERIHDTMCGEWKKQGRKTHEYSQLWDEYVSRDLLPRLFGFELMMAPYTVAHLKIGLKLSEFGYTPKRDERLNVFLTNTLEQAQQLALDMPEFLAKEAHEAQIVKHETRVTVVVGNPPYSGHSANENTWIRNLLRSKLPDGADSIFKVDGADLGERNPKWLNDDYVKFTRYAQFRLAQSGRGVLGFITNHGYLDNPTFRGLRQSLMHTFPAMWQLDLHGNSKRKERTPDGKPDENVFEIQQGVSLNFGVRNQSTPSVCHADLWGTQNEKYEWCYKVKFENVAWQKVEAKKPNYLFVRQSGNMRDEYECGMKIIDVMPMNSVGIVTARDELTLQDTPKEVWDVVRDFASLPPETARKKYELGADVRDWKVSLAQADLIKSGPNEENIYPVLYKPFNARWTYYTTTSRGFLCMPRGDVMQQMTQQNVALLFSRNASPSQPINHFFVTSSLLLGRTFTDAATITCFSPLYLYNPPINWDTQLLGTGKDGRRANLAPSFVAQLGSALKLQWQSDGRGEPLKRHAETKLSAVADTGESGDVRAGGQVSSSAPFQRLENKFGPEDILAYIYAIFHAPSYRSRYAEFLKIDFPRVPLTNDAALFWQLVEHGRALIDLHLLNVGAHGVRPESETSTTGRTPCAPTGDEHIPQGEIAAGYPKYENGKVVINKAGEGFDDVPEEVWNFHIGGYQVCHKWLKDRKGRTLSPDDAAHYRKIVYALGRTIEEMQAIDEIITQHGGWPLVGSQDVSPLSDEDVKSFFGQRDAMEVESRPTKTIAAHDSPTTAQHSKRDDFIAATPRPNHVSTHMKSTVEAVDVPPILMSVVRALFSDGVARSDETSLRDLADTFGIQRLTAVSRNNLELILETAESRGIIERGPGNLNRAEGNWQLSTRNIHDYNRDELIDALLAVMEKRTWHEREDVIVAATRHLGFARTGNQIRDAFKSAINGAIRRDLLEYEGILIRLK